MPASLIAPDAPTGADTLSYEDRKEQRVDSIDVASERSFYSALCPTGADIVIWQPTISNLRIHRLVDTITPDATATERISGATILVEVKHTARWQSSFTRQLLYFVYYPASRHHIVGHTPISTYIVVEE